MSLNIALAIFGGLTLLFSLTAGLMKRRAYPVSEPMLATLVGVLIGPLVLGVLDLSAWGDPYVILETIARLTTAVSVLGVALRLPDGYFSTHGRAMATVLGPGMLIMWLVSGLLAYVLLGLPFWVGMLIGAVLTPASCCCGGSP